ncbi:MAG: hypothetical protein AAFQ58_19250 [Pseudomonadota bacterium]
MDFINEQNRRDKLAEYEKQTGPSLSQVAGAVLRQETAIGSVLARERTEYGGNFHEPVGMDYLDGLDEKYLPYASSFVGLTEAGAEAQKRNLDRQLEDEAIRDTASGLLDFGLSIAVQPLDPVNYIPIGGTTFKGAKLGTKLARGARAGLAGAALQEPILAATQETRTSAEVVGNFAASAVFGMALGGAVHAFDTKTRRAIAHDPIPVQGTAERAADPDAQSINAAMVPQVSEADLVISSQAVQKVLDATPGVLGPTLRLMKAQALPVRRMAMELVENYLPVDGIENGMVTQAAETDIRRIAGSFEVKKGRALQEGYSAYVQETDGPSRLRVVSRYKDQRAFSERVGRAMRRGDVDPESPAVTEAAQRIRREVLDPFLKRAQAAGLLPEGMQSQTALSYFRRSWDQTALSARQDDFVQIATDYFTQGMTSGAFRIEDDVQARLSAAQSDLRTATEATEIGGRSRVEVQEMTAERADLLGQARSMFARPVIEALKARGIDPNSPAADELRHMGVNSQTAPGLFKRGGLRDVDAIDTLDDLDEVIARDDVGGGYLNRDDILEAIREEVGGSPRRTAVQRSIEKRLDDIERAVSEGGTGPTRAQLSKLMDEIENLQAETAALADDAIQPSDFEGYAEEAAQAVWNTLTGRDGGIENPIVSVVQGPLKGRTFMIPDTLVEDFLVDDAYEVLGQYIRTMSAEITLKERFGRADLRTQLDEVQNAYSEAKKGKSEAEAIKIDAERDKMIETIEAVRDKLRGTYMAKENATPLAAISRSARNVAFNTMLGDVVLSSLPDVFRMVQVHGLSNLLGPQGLKTLTRSAKALRKAGHENWLREETELAGIAEVFTKARVAAMADLHEPYAGAGRIETFTRALADVGGMASGVNHWNQFMKQVAWQHGVQRMKRVAEGKGKRKDAKWLRSLKVGPRDMDRISAQVLKHGVDRDGLWDANARAWDDMHAKKVFQNALSADANSVVVTPGVGDKPLFADHPLGAMAFQFKSFFAATHQRALMRGLAEDQVDFLTGAASMIAMGAMVYYLKGLSGNFEVSDNPGIWLAEGIDRSGVLAVPMEINNMFEPMLNQAGAGGVYTGLSSLFGDSAELSSRYRFRRDFVGETLLGPTAGLVGNAATISGAALGRVLGGQEFTEGDVNAVGRSIPFANHPGMKQFLRYFAIPEVREAVQ